MIGEEFGGDVLSNYINMWLRVGRGSVAHCQGVGDDAVPVRVGNFEVDDQEVIVESMFHLGVV